MKKTLALLLAAALACGMLTACSGGDSRTSQESSASEAASSAVIEGSAASETSGTAVESSAVETILVTDAIGREVELSGPVEKAAFINRYNLELIRGCGFIDKVVGVDSSIIENHVYWPEFSEENSFGSQNDINYEVIAEMEPDVVITAFYSEDMENALNAFNIPVVALIGYDQDINRQIDIIETMFGQSEKSAALRSFFNETSESISGIVAGIPEGERKTVAWESIKDYSIANGSNAWGEMMVLAGGFHRQDRHQPGDHSRRCGAFHCRRAAVPLSDYFQKKEVELLRIELEDVSFGYKKHPPEMHQRHSFPHRRESAGGW